MRDRSRPTHSRAIGEEPIRIPQTEGWHRVEYIQGFHQYSAWIKVERMPRLSVATTVADVVRMSLESHDHPPGSLRITRATTARWAVVKYVCFGPDAHHEYGWIDEWTWKADEGQRKAKYGDRFDLEGMVRITAPEPPRPHP